jgi:polyhydroxyalkanoate synthesis repressor PhaR
MAKNSGPADAPVVIKKYANRRLYNTATSTYVTLDDLSTMVKAEKEFVVFDAKSGEDITRSVLTQIIVEEESKGQHLLPIGFLRQLISYYGDSLQSIVPKYLEQSMDSFAGNQEQMRQYLSNAMEGMFPFGSLEDMSRQNMAFIEKAMSMINPFQAGADAKAGKAPNGAPETPAAEASDSGERGQVDALADLQRKIEALQDQVASLSQDKTKGR